MLRSQLPPCIVGSLPRFIDDTFDNVRRAVGGGSAGRLAFGTLRLLRTYFDGADAGPAFAELQSFGVPIGRLLAGVSRVGWNGNEFRTGTGASYGDRFKDCVV